MSLLDVHIKFKAFSIGKRQVAILNNIAFTAKKGEFVSIIGPSGSGKSTILKIIAGLQTEFEGNVNLNGKHVRGPGLDRGIVFQDHRLFPWLTVRDNIAFALPGHEQHSGKVEALIHFVGLNGFEGAYPNQLSGGMAQRVAIARAIINVPDVLLLDEAFGALDDLSRYKMQAELLRIVNENKTTTIMVTHNVDEAVALSDKILVLGNSPAEIIDLIEIDLPQPRDKKSNEFVHYRNKLITEL